MREKDLYENLIQFYEFRLGRLPHRDEFKTALQVSFTAQDLRLFFLLPFFGTTTMDELQRKAAKEEIPASEVQAMVRRLVPAGLVDSYVTESGRVCGRAPIIALLEFQVRLKEESPLRSACAKVMDALIETRSSSALARTPMYRVLPVEPTVTGVTRSVEVQVNTNVPDPREVLPIDVVSEMVRREPLIAVGDCGCRSTKNLVGKGCGHPLETCFYFNELAQRKLEAGYARRIDYEEAMRILRDCESQGLVHNVSNCDQKIQTLCNCCSCSCGVMKGIASRRRGAGAPSRFVVELGDNSCSLCGTCIDACPLGNVSITDHQVSIKLENCIGCGQCVSKCPEGALHMALRRTSPKIYADNDALFRRMSMEALAGLVVRKLTGR